MTRHIHNTHIHCRELKRAVFLLVMFTSVNALAATPVTTANETMAVDNNGHHATANQTPADPYEAIKWRSSTSKSPAKQSPVHKSSRFRTSGNSSHADTRKVFKQDYERVFVPVSSAKNTEMIWLAD